jgi:hypothetical protein
MKASWSVSLLLLLLVTLLISSCNPDASLDEQTQTPTTSDTQTDTTEPPSTDTPVPPLADAPVPTFSISDLEITLQKLLNSEEIHLEDRFLSNYDGCRINQIYSGVLSDGIAYSTQEQAFTDDESEMVCSELGVVKLYRETYWFDNRLLNRQYPEKNFEEIDPEGSLIISTHPREYLSWILNGIDSMRILSVNSQVNDLIIRTAIDSEDRKGELIFHLDEDNEISTIQYDFIFSVEAFEYQVSESYTYQVYEAHEIHCVGKMHFSKSYAITDPGFGDGDDPDFILSTLRDIQSFAEVNYDVFTEEFLIENDMEFVPEIYASFYGEDTPTSVNCYLNLPQCQGKLPQFVGIFERLETLLKDAIVIYCRADDSSREVSSTLSEKYEGLVSVKVSNTDRDPRNSLDFLFEVTFDVEGDDIGEYQGVINYGKEYCIEGAADLKALLEFQQALDVYADSLR